MAKEGKAKKVRPKVKKWRAIFHAKDLAKFGLNENSKSGELEALIRKRYGLEPRATKERSSAKKDLSSMLASKGIKVELNPKGKISSSKLLSALNEYLKEQEK